VIPNLLQHNCLAEYHLRIETRWSIFYVDTLVEVIMQTTVQKWGNSLAVRIPRSFASEIQIESGTEVDLSIKNNQLVIS
jgi:putative transposon-encoded protein